MHTRIVLASLLVLPLSSASAQDVDDRARRVETVTVIALTGEDIVGELVQLGPTLKLRVDEVVREIPLESVVRIDRHGDSVKNGALIGAAVGLLAGLSFVSEYGGEAAGFALASTATWALLGAGVDALIPGRTTIYRRPPSTPPPIAAKAVTFSWNVLF